MGLLYDIQIVRVKCGGGRLKTKRLREFNSGLFLGQTA